MLEEKKGTPLKNVRSFVPADGWHVIPAVWMNGAVWIVPHFRK
jgi:hypothetical protein